MGKLAVYRLGYFFSIVFTFLFLGLAIWSHFSGHFHPEASLFSAYLSLGKPLVIVLNAFMFVYWICRRKCWAIVSILGIAACYNYITAIWQPFNLHKSAEGKELKVMTYNTHSFGREVTGYSAKEFAGMVQDEKIDILCFQEYGGSGDFTNENLYETYSAFLPHTYLPQSHSMAIYSRYPILQSDVVEFENTNNCAIWADIDVEGTTLRVISVHMQTTSFDRMRSKAAQARAAANEEGERQIYLNFTDNLESNMIERANQALMVEEIMKSTDHPTILCGDFNDTPGTYTYETLKGEMKDGFQTGGKGFAWTYRGLYNLLRIDYIFHSKELKGLEYESMDYEMSDHNPVMMTLCIEE